MIELLVATMILGVLAAAISACLSGGMRAWESVQNFNSLELNILPPLQSLEKELRNSIGFYEIDFAGDEQGIQFAALVPAGDVPGSPLRIGTVRYFYDSTREVLLRKAWQYQEDEPDDHEIVMSGLSDVGFEYFYTSAAKGGSSREWGEFEEMSTNYLSAVRIRLVSGKERNGKERNDNGLVRTVVFPVARSRGKSPQGVAK